MKGMLIYQDTGGRKSTITLNGLNSANANVVDELLAVGLLMETYSNASVLEYGVIRPTIQDNPSFVGAVDTGVEYLSSMHKGLTNFTHVEDNETRVSTLFMPAPSVNCYDHTPEVGYRMKSDFGTYLRDGLRVATGNAALAFNQGVIEFREGVSARPSQGAFIEFEDFYLRKQYMGVPGVTAMGNLTTFANFLVTAPGADPDAKFTLCDWKRAGILVPEMVRRDATPDVEPGWDSVTIRAIMGFTWVESGRRRSMRMTLPAPRSEMFNFPKGKTRKVFMKPVYGDAIALSLTGLYGSSVRDLNFEYGYVDVSNGEG